MEKKTEVPEHLISDFIQFISRSPTAKNCVLETKIKLLHAGFVELKENLKWSIEAGKSYFVIRSDSALIAFKTSKEKPTEARILGSHLDSPGLLLKPNPTKSKFNYVMLSPQIYGGPTISTFVNVPLGIAGQVIVETVEGKMQTHMIYIKKPLATIAPVAIHLERSQGETLTINAQQHLSAICGVNLEVPKGSSLLDVILKKFGNIEYQRILSSELFLVPLYEPMVCGVNETLLLSPRLDDLHGAYTSIQALIEQQNPHKNRLQMVALWDHEEVGSTSVHGAQSKFLQKIIDRVCEHYLLSLEEKQILIRDSYLVSNDVAHAVHPNYGDLHEPEHQPLMESGVVVKFNANQRYATSVKGDVMLRTIANRYGIKVQNFVIRSDRPCGSTIGPLVSADLDIETIDIGSPILSMHSALELTSIADLKEMYQLLFHLLQD